MEKEDLKRMIDELSAAECRKIYIIILAMRQKKTK